MKTFLSYAIALGLLTFSPAALSALPQKPGNSIGTSTIIRAEFGLFNVSPQGKQTFVPATVVPMAPGQAYGWIIQLHTDKEKIRWLEEFTLPTQPSTWGENDPQVTRSVSNNGRTSITEREVAPDQSLIYHSWAVAPGDPKGKYTIRVFIEGSLAKKFEFEVK